MTKKLLTALMLIGFATTGFSQEYVPLLGNPSWNVVAANFGGPTNYIIHPGIDVTIGNFTYKKFFDPTTNEDVYLREDAAAKKVYKRINGTDQVFYDFSLQTGDVITLGNNTYTVTVSNINVNGGTRRKLYLYTMWAPGETWIEGVGSNMHPLRPSYELPSDPYYYTTCSAQDGVAVYNHGLANGVTPTDCNAFLGMDGLDALPQKITFAPMPFQMQMTINSAQNLDNGTLVFYNMLGQVVKEYTKLNGTTISVSRENLSSGVYLAQLSDNGKILHTAKIIVTD